MFTKPASFKIWEELIAPTCLVWENVPDKSVFSLVFVPKVALCETTKSIPLDSVSIAFAKKDAAEAFAWINNTSNSEPVPGPLN